MRFNLDQLQAFTATVDQGSFSAAARRLGKAQSAVSTAVANLELDLNVRLFDRSRREPTLTEQGHALLPKARALLEQATSLQGHADAMAAGEEGRLSIAVEESLIGPELETLLQSFEQQFPQLELEFLNPARMDILELLASGRVDIGLQIATFIPARGYRIRPMGEMTMIAVAASDHPLVGKKELSFDQLLPWRQLVLTSRGSDRLYPNEQISSRVWKIESQFGLLELAKRKLGWAWVPEHMACDAISRGELKTLSIEGGADCSQVPVDLLTSSHYQEGKAGQWLFEQLPRLSFLSHPAS